MNCKTGDAWIFSAGLSPGPYAVYLWDEAAFLPFSMCDVSQASQLCCLHVNPDHRELPHGTWLGRSHRGQELQGPRKPPRGVSGPRESVPFFPS